MNGSSSEPNRAPEPPLADDPRRVGDDEPPGGLFRSWGGLYIALVIWGVLCIVGLWFVTVALNAPGTGAGP